MLAALGFLAVVLQQVAGKWTASGARFVLASAAWLFAWAAVTVGLRASSAASGPGIYSDATRQALMVLALFGFALNAIYGFGQKLLSGFLGIRTPRRGLVEAAFWLHNFGVPALLLAGGVGSVLPAWPGSLALAMAAVLYALGMRGFVRVRHVAARPELGERFLDRYVQLAFFWLLAGLALLLFGDLYAVLRGTRLPHAYAGAARHALTVGFMTTLILGVGQRLLPILGHTLHPRPRLVGPIFALIATGNLLRVLSELATPLFPVAYVVMPFSAVLELAALALFTAVALRTLWPAPDSLIRMGQATVRTPVAILLAEHPWMEDHLLAWGCGYVGRVRSVPAELTLGTLAETEGLDPQETVARINALLQTQGQAAAPGSVPSPREEKPT